MGVIPLLNHQLIGEKHGQTNDVVDIPQTNDVVLRHSVKTLIHWIRWQPFATNSVLERQLRTLRNRLKSVWSASRSVIQPLQKMSKNQLFKRKQVSGACHGWSSKDLEAHGQQTMCSLWGRLRDGLEVSWTWSLYKVILQVISTFDICQNKLCLRRVARCSFMVRAFAHGAMGRRIDPSWWTHWTISRSIQCSTTGVTKAVVYVILSVGWCI